MKSVFGPLMLTCAELFGFEFLGFMSVINRTKRGDADEAGGVIFKYDFSMNGENLLLKISSFTKLTKVDIDNEKTIENMYINNIKYRITTLMH